MTKVQSFENPSQEHSSELLYGNQLYGNQSADLIRSSYNAQYSNPSNSQYNAQSAVQYDAPGMTAYSQSEPEFISRTPVYPVYSTPMATYPAPQWKKKAVSKALYFNKTRKMNAAADILLCLGIVGAVLLIVSWFMNAVVIVPEYTSAKIHLMRTLTGMHSTFGSFCAMGSTKVSISLYNILLSMASTSSLALDLSIAFQPSALLNTEFWVTVASGALAMIGMLAGLYYRNRWTRFLPLAGLIAAGAGILLFIQNIGMVHAFVDVLAAEELTDLTIMVGAGGYVQLVSSILLALASVLPLFFKD